MQSRGEAQLYADNRKGHEEPSRKNKLRAVGKHQSRQVFRHGAQEAHIDQPNRQREENHDPEDSDSTEVGAGELRVLLRQRFALFANTGGGASEVYHGVAGPMQDPQLPRDAAIRARLGGGFLRRDGDNGRHTYSSCEWLRI
jgi:hypothetical protein